MEKSIQKKKNSALGTKDNEYIKKVKEQEENSSIEYQIKEYNEKEKNRELPLYLLN